MNALATTFPTVAPTNPRETARPASLWRALEEIPTGIASEADWRYFTGHSWSAFQRAFLDPLNEPVRSCHCPRECGCAHRVVHHDDGRIVGVCECEPWNCDNLPLTANDVAAWQFNRARLGRALCRAFDLDRCEQALGLPWTQQIATFSAAAVPVILTIQQERHEFREVVAELAARWRDGFILFVPTSRLVDGRVLELLAHAQARFFDLESHVVLLPTGGLHASKPAGQLFARFVTNRDEMAGENEARRVFATLQKLRSTSAGIKAPLYEVFMAVIVDGLSQREAARKCGCSLGLISARVEELEREFKRNVSELQAMAVAFVELQTTVRGDERRGRRQRASGTRWEDVDLAGECDGEVECPIDGESDDD